MSWASITNLSFFCHAYMALEVMLIFEIGPPETELDNKIQIPLSLITRYAIINSAKCLKTFAIFHNLYSRSSHNALN